MRVSTTYLFNQNLSAMLDQQSALGRTQQQVSTGMRILSPSDDPAGAVQVLNLKREISLTDQYIVNSEKAENKQTIEEGTLDGATNMLQRIRELAIQGLNDTNTQSDRKAIAVEINQLNEQLLAMANTRDSSGDYLFSGFKSGTQPYETLNGEYQGDEGQRSMKVGASVLIETNDPGNSVFESKHISTIISQTTNAGAGDGNIALTARDGGEELTSPITFTYDATASAYIVTDGATPANTATIPYSATGAGLNVDLSTLNPALPKITVELTGTPDNTDAFEIATTVTTQSMFKTIDQFVKALQVDEVNINNGPNNGDFLTNISSSMNTVIDTQAKIGARLNSIDHQREINDGISFNMQKTLSEVQDLDYAEAISRLSLQMTGMQAAQQSFVKVQGLSLFNYL
ncbi:MAG: flagellar hook-associated protein FlgL [Methylococcales bacterium]|nr:flagellar hook-associated protein FlgL [Methylococcales bacterium]